MSDTQSVIWQMSTYGNSQTFQPAKRSSALAPAAEIQAVPSDLTPLTNAYTPKADIPAELMPSPINDPSRTFCVTATSDWLSGVAKPIYTK